MTRRGVLVGGGEGGHSAPGATPPCLRPPFADVNLPDHRRDDGGQDEVAVGRLKASKADLPRLDLPIASRLFSPLPPKKKKKNLEAITVAPYLPSG